MNNKWMKFCILRPTLDILNFNGNMRFFGFNGIICNTSIFWCYRESIIKKKKIYIKPLTYLASLEVYYHCYKIIEYFIYSSYYYCLCDRYQGCLRQPFGGEDYCCVCKTRIHYSFEKLNSIKHNSFKLQKFYLNLLRDLTEIEKIDPTACFWDG